MSEEETKAPLTEHLEELRRRLIRCFIAIGVGFCIAYSFKEKLFEILTRPLVSVMDEKGSMIFTGLPEAFFTYLKVSLLAGIILALPVIFYEFWMFVAPGLYRRERRVVLPVVLISLLFFAAGAMFGYFLVFPFGFKFFLGFANDRIQALPSMREYLAFSSKLLLAFGLAFELPLVVTLFARFGFVSLDFLKKNRKYAVLLFFTAAAILTPPDVVTQVLLAVPLMALYELSILGARIFGKKSEGDDETGQEDGDESKGQDSKKKEGENDG